MPLSGTSFAEWVLDRIDLRTLSDVLDAGAGDQQVFPDAAALVSAYRTTGRFRAASDQVAIDEADLVEAAEQIAAEWVGGQGGELISPIVMGAFVGTGPHR